MAKSYDCNWCGGKRTRKGNPCEGCGGTGRRTWCYRLDCIEYGCGGFGDCFAPPEYEYPPVTQKSIWTKIKEAVKGNN